MKPMDGHVKYYAHISKKMYMYYESDSAWKVYV